MINAINFIIYILKVAVALCVIYLILNIPYKFQNLGVAFRIYYFPFKSCTKIVQRKIGMPGHTPFQKLAAFAREQHTLETELPSGVYTLTTHTAVLKRIEACKTISIISCRKVYRRSLVANYSALIGAKHSCRNKQFEIKQFYKIKIKKE